ncbi:MAG: LD-carboxypeptidase [Gammaproteobacteria bacterium]|jgi:muramoyltetrapeptide carboxypeptidase|nr:LD-carboxypeptidase [Gammaproteobacteria bacterium]
MKKLPVLKAGDNVEIIAPASRCSDVQLKELKELLLSWQLNPILPGDIFGDDLLCANTDEMRFQFLRNALINPKTKAIICARGGYGCMRLIPELIKMRPPPEVKLFVGMSDITALNLYLQQQWQWPVLHGAPIIAKFSPESITAVKSILLGEVERIEFAGLPLNIAAEENHLIKTSITGGNLSLVQASIGTKWQLDGNNKIIFLEEIGERGYRVDRMLEHLRQAGIFKKAKAIVFGDFTGGKEPDGSYLIKPVLERFAKNCKLPIVKVDGIGHGYTNFPLPLGTEGGLQLGHEIKLTCFR